MLAISMALSDFLSISRRLFLTSHVLEFFCGRVDRG